MVDNKLEAGLKAKDVTGRVYIRFPFYLQVSSLERQPLHGADGRRYGVHAAVSDYCIPSND